MGPGTRRVRDVYEQARARWPVKSGRSKAALTYHDEVDLRTGDVRARITNNVQRDGLRYSSLITTSVREGMESVPGMLLRRPLAALRRRLIRDLGPEISAAAGDDGGRS